MNKRKAGACWEQKAAEYLTSHGMRILEKNFRIRSGEIDIIGFHQGYLVFVEVKYRRGIENGYASEAVDLKKRKQICKVADYYRMVHNIGDHCPIRYDVVAFQGEELEWIQNAFWHIYTKNR